MLTSVLAMIFHDIENCVAVDIGNYLHQIEHSFENASEKITKVEVLGSTRFLKLACNIDKKQCQHEVAQYRQYLNDP